MFWSDYPPTLHQPLCLGKEEWKTPELVFHKLFGELSRLPKVMDGLKTLFKFAISDKPLPGNKCFEVYEAYGDILRVIEAGSLLPATEKAVLPDTADWMAPQWWMGSQVENTKPFDYFPRHLTDEAYCHPYRVFYKAREDYTLPQWRCLLEDYWHAACCHLDIYEINPSMEVFEIQHQLPALLEAAHLIYARELNIN